MDVSLEQYMISNRDAPFSRERQPGHAVEQGGFSGTGGSEQDREPRQGNKIHLQQELAFG
jgi:hypothetical protein